jgi:hypothetical protein
MNTRPLILAFAAALALGSAAAPADDTPVAQKPAAADAAKPAAKAPVDCPQTGTRLRHKAPHCVSASPLRSYSQQELQMTGETDLGQALKKLDPIFH